MLLDRERQGLSAMLARLQYYRNAAWWELPQRGIKDLHREKGCFSSFFSPSLSLSAALRVSHRSRQGALGIFRLPLPIATRRVALPLLFFVTRDAQTRIGQLAACLS